MSETAAPKARPLLRLGTRGSPLALRQSEWVAERLREAAPAVEVELRRIRTSGDRLPGSLVPFGGKGLFVKEIEEALLAGEVDAGVHSLKDLPVRLPAGLALAAVLEREDPSDVLISRQPGGLAGLLPGSRVGTSSLRRQALVRHLRPDVEVVPLRGNVETRLRRWREGEVDAVILARAGLKRLGLAIEEADPLPVEVFLPAIGQGAIGIEASPASEWWTLFQKLDHAPTARAVEAERAFLRAVGGDCHTPVAAHARVQGHALELRALVASPDGSRLVRGERRGSTGEAPHLGEELAFELLARGGREILEGVSR